MTIHRTSLLSRFATSRSVLIHLTLAGLLALSLPSAASAQATPNAQRTCPGLDVRVLSAERATTWAGVGRDGYSFSSAPAGREFLILKFEVQLADSNAYPPLPYTRIADSRDTLFNNTGGGTRTDSRTAFGVEHFYSVPAGTAAKTLVLGRFVRAADAPPGQLPDWKTECTLDLRRVKFTRLPTPTPKSPTD